MGFLGTPEIGRAHSTTNNTSYNMDLNLNMDFNMDDMLEQHGDVLDSEWVLLFPDVFEATPKDDLKRDDLKRDSDGDVEMTDDFGDDGRGNGLQTPTKTCEGQSKEDDHDFLFLPGEVNSDNEF